MNGHKEPPFPICTDTSDCIEISFTSGLYLKPISKLSITVTIPQLKCGQIIINKEIIDKLKTAIKPDTFASIKATKSNLEFFRFDAELDNKKKAEFVINKIDQKGLKLTGCSEVLKVRATEGKIPFPSRQEWDSYFKDAKHMNEKKPGERPDTVHIKDIPCEWFIHNDDPTRACPCAYVVSKVFSSFGEIRAIDIPCLDPYRKQMSAAISGVNKFSFTEARLFEVYIQYSDYVGFVKCMYSLQAKKLVLQKDELAYVADMKVDFDKTRHMSDASMKRREEESKKIMAKSIHFNEKSRLTKELSLKKDAYKIEKYNVDDKKRKNLQDKKERKKLRVEKIKKREIKRRLRKLMKKHNELTDMADVEAKLTIKVSIEERKLVVAERRVEGVRLFEKIFDRIKTYHQKETEIKTAMHASGIQSEPVLFGHWFNANCQTLVEQKKFLHEQFVSVKTNENWLHYKKCIQKLKKVSQIEKLNFIGSCLKNTKCTNNKVLDERKRKELIKCKKAIKLSKARLLDQLCAQRKRLDKVGRGKIRVSFLPSDDENQIALSPASSESSSSSSATSGSDESENEENSFFAGKGSYEQGQEFYRNPVQFRGGHYNNFRSYEKGQHFPNDDSNVFRYFRPQFSRGFRGGPHQGFENRGRGFYQFRGRFPYDKNRGRGGYNRINEHPIQLGSEKWFKKGNGEEESYFESKLFNKYKKLEYCSDSRSSSRKRSRSWSYSRSGSRKRSRYLSDSRSRSRDRSPSLSDSRSRSRRRSPSWSDSRSESRKRSRRYSDSRSKSPRSSSKLSDSRSRFEKRSPSWSDSRSEQRKRSRLSSEFISSTRQRNRKLCDSRSGSQISDSRSRKASPSLFNSRSRSRKVSPFSSDSRSRSRKASPSSSDSRSRKASPYLSDSRSECRKRSQMLSDSRSSSRQRSRMLSDSRSSSRQRSRMLSDSRSSSRKLHYSRSESRKNSPSWSYSKSSPRKLSPSASDSKSSLRKSSTLFSSNKYSSRRRSTSFSDSKYRTVRLSTSGSDNSSYRNHSRSRSRSNSRSKTRPEKFSPYSKRESRHSNDFRDRSHPLHSYKDTLRHRRPNGSWRGGGRRHFNSGYNESDDIEENHEQHFNLYKKYFNNIEEEKYDSQSKIQKIAQVVDNNGCYREEEERARAGIIQHQVKKLRKRHQKY